MSGVVPCLFLVTEKPAMTAFCLEVVDGEESFYESSILAALSPRFVHSGLGI